MSVVKLPDPDFKVTADGQLVHWATGEPVRAGDMTADGAYRFDRSELPPRTLTVPTIYAETVDHGDGNIELRHQGANRRDEDEK